MRPPLSGRRALLAWTKRQLARLRIKPRKSRGQNYVVDPRLVFEVAGHVRGCSLVVEPGSGLGTLTALLAERAGRVFGVEVDPRFTLVLREVQYEYPTVDVVIADFMTLEARGPVDCVAGNPPYSITGPLVSRIVTHYSPRRAILTLQREVAARLAARPGTPAYGRLTVLVQLVYEVRLGGVYPPSSFYPPPEVYSQLVVLEKKADLEENVLRRVEELTRCLFSERNKLASKVVRKCCGAERDFGERRVYQLSPGEILELALECEGIGRAG